MARADNRDARPRQRFNISAHIKDQRRIVDFAQAGGPAFILTADDLNTGGRGFRNLVMRQLQRFSQSNVLGRLRLQVFRFKLGQRGVKDILNVAKTLPQLASASWAEARRKRQRQPVN